jgi:hypothetical protein
LAILLHTVAGASRYSIGVITSAKSSVRAGFVVSETFDTRNIIHPADGCEMLRVSSSLPTRLNIDM